MIRDFIIKYDKTIYLTIGLLLVILSICMVSYDKFSLVKDSVFVEVSKEISSELMDENYIETEDVSVITNEVEEEDIEEETSTSTSTKSSSGHKRVYIGYLSITKLNLYVGIVSMDSYYNNVNKGVLTVKGSSYPTEENSNLILASHSGTSSVSYFRNLYKLSLGDKATLYYQNVMYEYKIVNKYDVPKVGIIQINRDTSKTTLTLITCTKGNKKTQTVYILELCSKDGVSVNA